MSKKLRIILDTNLWISYLISKRLQKIDVLFEQELIVLIFSQELLDEFLEVAQRPKFERYFSKEKIATLLRQFEQFAEFVEVHSKIELCRDPKDNFLLALSKDGNAHYLVTGDKDLLEIGEFEGTRILTYAEFEAL